MLKLRAERRLGQFADRSLKIRTATRQPLIRPSQHKNMYGAKASCRAGMMMEVGQEFEAVIGQKKCFTCTAKQTVL